MGLGTAWELLIAYRLRRRGGPTESDVTNDLGGTLPSFFPNEEPSAKATTTTVAPVSLVVASTTVGRRLRHTTCRSASR